MHWCGVILHAVWKKRMWVTAGGFPEWRVVRWLKARGKKGRVSVRKMEVNIAVLSVNSRKLSAVTHVLFFKNSMQNEVTLFLDQFLQIKQLYTTGVFENRAGLTNWDSGMDSNDYWATIMWGPLYKFYQTNIDILFNIEPKCQVQIQCWWQTPMLKFNIEGLKVCRN